MLAHPAFGGPSFKLVAKGLVELHRLIREGKDDSPEAESVRDTLEGPLKALNRAEKERAQWLSEDLYSVSAPPAAAGQASMDADAQRQLNAAIEARDRGDWDGALGLFRGLQDNISPDLLSFYRGVIWADAGYPDVAVEFFNHASDRDPANAHYRELYMEALADAAPEAARVLAEQVLADEISNDPLIVAQAATIVLQDSSHAPDSVSQQLFRRLIPILERNLTRLVKAPSGPFESAAYESTLGKLGILHELLGNSSAAVAYFSRGLQVNPNNYGLLAARGVLLYGSSSQAISDLEQSVRLGVSHAWPYFVLAHHYLATSRFEDCRQMCELGLKMSGSDVAKSQLEEWRAIAQAELGFPSEAVRAGFEAAVRLDPSNEFARRNQAVFEASLQAPGARPSGKWEQKTEAAVRQLGLSEQRLSMAA